MKIAFVLDDTIDSTDGVQQYVRTLGGWLQQQGHEVHYIAGQSHASAQVHSLTKNIKITFNGNRLSIPLPASSQKIRRLLEQENYDVLHIQMPYSPAMAGKVIKLAPSSTAIVATFHIMPYGALHALSNRLLGRAQQHSLKRLHEFCFVSSVARGFAEKNYHISGQVIPNMIKLDDWHNAIKPVSGKIVFLGRLVPRKGCRQLLLAVAELPAEIKDKLNVIIAGDGPERQKLEKLCLQLGVQATFRGYVSELDKKKLLATADLAVFPSLGGESFGIVLLEAMAAGAGVVVAGENPGYQAVLGALPTCLLDFRNTKAATQQLKLLLRDKKVQKKLHAQQQHTVKRYDTAVVGPQIMAMYERALLHSKRDMR